MREKMIAAGIDTKELDDNIQKRLMNYFSFAAPLHILRFFQKSNMIPIAPIRLLDVFANTIKTAKIMLCLIRNMGKIR